MQRAIRHLPAVVLLAANGAAHGQVCDVAMSFKECAIALDGAQTEALQDVAEADRSEALGDLDTANTGAQTGFGSAVDDFNPPFQVSIDSKGLSADESGGLTLTWNDLLRNLARNRLFGDDGSIESTGLQHKLQVTLRSPELYEPLKEALTDPVTIGELDESLDDFDDVSIDFRLALSSGNFGRSINNHASVLDAIQRVSMEQTRAARDAMFSIVDQRDQVVQRIINSGGRFDEDEPFQSITDDATARELVRFMEASRAAHVDYADAYEAAARRNHLFDFLGMVSNQPQLVLALNARQRSELAGPDEYSAKLVYEFGAVNINTYKRFRRNVCRQGDGALAHAAEVDCLANFVSRNGNQIDTGNRFALSAEYLRRDSYRIDDHGVMLDLDDQTSFVAKLTYGRYLDFGKEFAGVGGRSRIDLSASYDDVSSDPSRQDRAIANLTLSQEVGDGLFLTASLAWANKPEFRIDAGEDITAQFGISYKLPGEQ